jgi:cyclic pyranopterin phosphate synthase
LDRKYFVARNEILSYEELYRVIKIFSGLGINKIRLTGGEPTLRPQVHKLIEMLKSISKIDEISMTTNGVLLPKIGQRLYDAGLDRLNISLDTLNAERYAEITGKDCFEDVWQGLLSSYKIGFKPIKINVVLLQDFNIDEIDDFAELTLKYPFHIRFIELFNTTERLSEQQSKKFLSLDAKKIIEDKFGKLTKQNEVIGNGPSQNYVLPNAKGTIGFISNLSENFCNECNRLRMDSQGRIAPCLFSGYLYELKPLLRSDKSDVEIATYLKKIIEEKPNYNKHSTQKSNFVEMSSVGG